MADYVLDGSVTLAWCFEDEADATAEVAWKWLRDGAAFVPAHWPLEVANGLVVGERRNRLTASDANEFWLTLNRARITVDNETRQAVCPRTLDLARAHRLTAYDAAYLELALRLDLPLATLDQALLAAAVATGVSNLHP